MNKYLRGFLLIMVVILSGCADYTNRDFNQYVREQVAIIEEEKASCIYGGHDRHKVLNNVVYKDEIKADFEKCMQLSSLDSDVDKCAAWAHTINGGIWVTEEFNSPMTLNTLAQIEQNITQCQDLEKLSKYKVDTL